MWKKGLIGLGGFMGLVVAGGVGLFGYVQLTWDKSFPDTPYPALAASTDPEVIAQGEYLVRGPAHCSNCHVGSLEEFVRADGGEELPLSGGWVFEMGPIGNIATKNLTPDPETGIGRYEDKELFRLLRHNVRPNHKATIAPMMPFQNMADDDLVAIVSYLRSLEPVRNEVPENEWKLMAKVMFAFGPPAPFAPVVGHTPPKSAPPIAPTVERGEYLANSVANCRACHTPLDPLTTEVIGPEFSGSANPEPSLVDPNVMVRPPNITTGGALKQFPTEEAFVERFRRGRVIPESYMHWGPFSRMHEDDIKAIYRYLQTVPPSDNDTGPYVVAG